MIILSKLKRGLQIKIMKTKGRAEFTPLVFFRWGLSSFSLVFCVVLLCVCKFWSSMLWCPLRFIHTNDIRFVFTSLPVVCRRAHVLFTLFAYSGVQHILCCVIVLFVFILCLVYLMLSVSLDCLFLIATLVFSNLFKNNHKSPAKIGLKLIQFFFFFTKYFSFHLINSKLQDIPGLIQYL